MKTVLSYQQRPNGHRRSGQPKMEWTIRFGAKGKTIDRYHCSPDTFDPQRLVELVNRAELAKVLIEKGLVQ